MAVDKQLIGWILKGFFFSSALVLLLANLTEEKLIIIKCKSKGFGKEYFAYSQKSARLYTYSNWRETYVKQKLSYREYPNNLYPTVNLSSIFIGNRLKIKKVRSFGDRGDYREYWTIKDAKKIKGSYDGIYIDELEQEEHKMTCKLHDTYSLG